MMARSKVGKAVPTKKPVVEEPLTDRDFEALEECEESSAKEIHVLIEREKDSLISLEKYAAKRGIKF
jgi:hypothetical protein